MTTKSKRSKVLYGTVGMTPIMAMMVTAQPAYAALLGNQANTIDLCSGVTLPSSDLTALLTPVANSISTLEGTTNSLLGGLTGPLFSALGLPSQISTNLGGTVTSAINGNLSLKVANANGTLIGPSAGCYAQTDGVTLKDQKGIAIGGNAITGLGDGTKDVAVAGELNSIAFGNKATTDATAANAIALGPNSTVAAGATNGIAIGNGSTASVANSVALGAGSMASRAIRSSYSGYLVGAGQVSAGEVSVGSASAQRQITNVAAGDADTDAVNVAQLKVLGNQVGGLDTRITNNTTAINAVNTRVDVTNNNLATTNNTVTALQNNVTNGNIGVWRYSDANGTPTGGTVTNNITVVGGAAGPVGVHNVAAGTLSSTSNDAVNGAQLYGLQQTVTTNNTTLTNQVNTVDARVTQVDGRVSTVDNRVTQVDNRISGVSDSVTAVDNRVTQVNGRVTDLDALAVKYDMGSGQTRITLGGGANGTKITNVAAGTLSSTSTDAVNGAQLDATNRSITSAVGTINTTINAVDARVTNNANAITLTNTTLAGVDTRVTANTNAITNIDARVTQNASDIGDLDARAVQYDAGTSRGRITLGGSGGSVLTNLKAGAVSATSTDAVNGAQLYTVQQSISDATGDLGTRITNVDNRVTNVDARVTSVANDFGAFSSLVQNGGVGPVQYSNGGTAANGGTLTQDVTLVGAAAGAVHLHNVDDGQIAQGSKDAVNGGQIFALQNSLGALSDLAVAYDDASKGVVTLGGAGAPAAVSLRNVGAGRLSASSTDAVNGAQLYDTRQTLSDVATNVGAIGDTVTNIDNRVTTIDGRVSQNSTDIANLDTRVTNTSNSLSSIDARVTTNTTNVTNLDGRVTNIDNRVTQNTTTIAGFGDRTALLETGGAGPVQFTNGGTMANGGTPTQDMALVGADSTQPVRLHNVAAGLVAHGSTDAVNGEQLYDSIAQGVSDLAVAYDDSTHGAVTLGGTGAPAVLVSNLKDGTLSATSSDAVNGAQLFATNQNVSTITSNLTGVTNTVTAMDARVTQNTTNLTSLGNRTTLIENGGAGTVQFSNGGTAANGGTATQHMTLVGADPARPVQLHNVADGNIAAGSTDAVNGGQLFNAVIGTVSDIAVAYDDGTHTQVTLGGSGSPAVQLTNVKAGTISATSSDAVTGAQLFDTRQSVTAIDARVTQNTTNIANFGAQARLLASGGAGTVQFSNGGTASNGGTPTQNMTLVGADPARPVQLHNVADGNIAAGSTDAVNGGQLFNAVIGTVSDIAVAYDDSAKTQVTLGSAGGPAVLLTNVKAGALSAGSTDAVNGAQLAGLGSAVATRLGGFSFDPASNSLSGTFSYNGNTYSDVQSVLGAIQANQSSGVSADGKYFHANSVAADSSASGNNSTAIGPSSSSAGDNSVAMGANASAESDHSVAIGSGATATGGMAVSIGMGNTASGDGAVAIGDPSTATGDGAVVLGKDDNATGIGAIALGNTNTAIGDGAAAVGNLNTASGQGAVALGTTNSTSGLGSIAIGSNNQVTGDGSLAIGSGITSLATDTLAIGTSADAIAVSAMAIGNRSLASGAQSLSVGADATANADQASAFGNNANAGGRYATAVGAMAQASNAAASALGIGATASGFASTAIGAGATVTHDNSVALGAAVQTTRGAQAGYTAFGLAGAQDSNGEIAIAQNMVYTDPRTGQLSTIGNRQITGVAAGSADADAVNVAQLRGVSSSLGSALASSLGGGASYDTSTGAVTAPSYTLGGVSYASVGDALNAIARSTGTGTGGGTATDPNAVSYSDAGRTTVTLAAGGTTIHNVADGTVAVGSTDAVNGGQLAAVQAQVQNGAVGAVRYSNATAPTTANGGTVTNDVTLVGADAAAPVALHNVADGTVAAGSTDAVNGGQLAATNARVATVEATATTAMTMGQNSAQYDSPARTSMTLGNGSDAVGLHNVADGTSAHDAVNLGQLNSAAASAVEQSTAYTDQRIKALSFDLGKVRKDASAGVAGAMALAGMPQPTEAGRGMVSMGMGAFQGQQAIALGIAKALSDEHTLVKVGATYNTRGQAGLNLGVGYQF